MSNLSIATAAALLIASIASVEAYAQSGGYLAPARFPTPALNPAARWFETDPDPRIRFEMKKIPRDTYPASLANETNRVFIDDCVHTLFPQCDNGG